jgi:hypothetical protein
MTVMGKIQNTLLFFAISSSLSLFAQQVSLTEVCKLDPVLKESSGLVVAGGKIWTQNDSGDPVLYSIDKTGKIKDAIYIGSKNKDWEDLTKDDAGNVYVGSIGNNANKRNDLEILKIPDPSTIKDKVVTPEVIQYSYPDQHSFPPLPNEMNFDAEAMIWLNDNIYIFTKNRTIPFNGYSKVYRVPAKKGKYVAELIDSVYLGPEPMISNWVTSADISPDKTKLVLLTHDKMWLFTCFQGDKFFSGKKYTLNFGTMSQKEGVCFINNNELYFSDEYIFKTGGKLYYLNLSNAKIEPCK